MKPNAVTSCLMQNGKFKQPNQEFTLNINRQLKMEWNTPSAGQDLFNVFSPNEVVAAIKKFKAG